jgi:hypothetical protein
MPELSGPLGLFVRSSRYLPRTRSTRAVDGGWRECRLSFALVGWGNVGLVGGLRGKGWLGAGLQRSMYRIVAFSLKYLHRSMQ